MLPRSIFFFFLLLLLLLLVAPSDTVIETRFKNLVSFNRKPLVDWIKACETTVTEPPIWVNLTENCH